MKLDPKMTISELLKCHPTVAKVFIKQKMLCLGCPAQAYHMIEDAARLLCSTRLIRQMAESLMMQLAAVPRIDYIVPVRKGYFSAPAASICGVSCAAYKLYASAKSLGFLAGTKNSSFPVREPIVSHPEFPDGNYIVSHHAEQDHSGSIPQVLEKYPQARVISTPKAKSMLIDLLKIPEEVFITVEDGETISLGDMTLKFIHTPWVHWPETMSTYLVERNILFSCDFYGSHIAASE